MEWYHMVLLVAACGAAILAWNVPRAPQWVALGAILFVISAMWHNYGLPYATAFGAGTNFVMIGFLWYFADQKWELRLWNFYHLMLVVDLLYIGGVIREKFIFAASLEIINLVALLFIVGTGLAERLSDGTAARGSYSGRTGFIHRALFATARAPGR